MHLQHPDQDAAAVIAVLDEAGLQRACVLSPGYRTAPGCESAACEGQQPWTRKMNDWAIRDATGVAPERLLPFCGVPIAVDWAATEVERCGRSGARGLKLHVVREHLSLLDADVVAGLTNVLQAAATAKLPVLIHVPMESADEVNAFFRIAASVPEADVIAAHQIAQNLPLLLEAPENLWIEISGLTFAPTEAHDAFVAIWRKFGTDRIILGSDWPTMGLTPVAHVELLRQYPLTPEEFELILEGNGRELLPPR